MKSLSVVSFVLLFLASVLTAKLHSQTLTVLHSFQGSPDGALPIGSLIRDAAGNLYGTTELGGNGTSGGTVFRIDPSGNETVLYGFTGGIDGGEPNAAVIADRSGNLYGTAAVGGLYNQGVVFKLDRHGRQTVLHHFTGGDDGGLPEGPLILDSEGNLYGTTFQGGAYSEGAVFKVSANGDETVLHSFHRRVDGKLPQGGLIRDKAGNFYGYTALGGMYNVGTLFKLNKNGKEIGLFSFAGKVLGNYPAYGTLVSDGAGNVYGTTPEGGGGICDCGIVYKLDAAGHETPLHVFRVENDGGNPKSGLIRDTNGNLYGTTYGGGVPFGSGTVFKIDPSGNETVLYTFSGGADGAEPAASLIMDADGNLYGTTKEGGAYGQGVVFKLTP